MSCPYNCGGIALHQELLISCRAAEVTQDKNPARTARLEANRCILFTAGRPKSKFLFSLRVCNIPKGEKP